MKVVKVVDTYTSDKEEVTEVPQLIGHPKASAYYLNYGAHGYA